MDAYIKKIRTKLLIESLIKSAALAAVIAAVCATVVALIVWLAPNDASVSWIAVGVFIGLTAAVTPVMYFVKFRVTDSEMARRLDKLGLSERMVTMYEYTGTLIPSKAGDTKATDSAEVSTAMLNAQVADTHKALGSLVAKGTTAGLISISAATVIPLIAALVPFGGMVTVGALADTEIIPTGYEIIKQTVIDPVTEKYYIVNYRTSILNPQTGMPVLDSMGKPILFDGVGGMIEGNDEQLIAYTVNSDNEVLTTSEATPVLAVADDDYEFKYWDINPDLTDPYRWDTEITPMGSNYEYDDDGNIVITFVAYFIELPDPEGGGGDGSTDEDGDSDEQDGDGDKDGDKPQDMPNDDDMQDSDKKPDDSDSDQDKDTDNGDPNDQRGGNYNPDKDNIIDGNQNYRDLYRQYYEEAMEIIASGGELPEYYKKIIETYFGVIV